MDPDEVFPHTPGRSCVFHVFSNPYRSVNTTMATPELTPETYAKLRQLHFDRERVLKMGWLHSGTPVSSEQEDYEDFIEYRKKKEQPMAQSPPPVPVVVLMVPMSNIPFVPPEISKLLCHTGTFSNIQVGNTAYICDNGDGFPIGADAWRL